MITGGAILLMVLTAQRLIELRIAKAHTEKLMARGAREFGADHYPMMVTFHGAWLAVMWLLGWDAQLVLFWAAIYAALQVFRVWILRSLGERWTTRIIIINEPLVRKGPYKFMSHPNYWLVVGEIAAVPLALGEPLAALLFSIIHVGVLWVRIRAENTALETITAEKDIAGRDATAEP